MRYGPIADNIMEERVLGLPNGPRVLYDTFLPVVQAGALMAAARSGVFESLRDGPRHAIEISAERGLDHETLRLVLRVLCASNYLLMEHNGRVALSDTARCTLLADTADSLTAWVAFIDMLWQHFAQIDNVLRTGRGCDLHDDLRNGDEWGIYQKAMLENARRTAPYVATVIPVQPGATRLLDIAGSHGLFGGLIARAYPPMRAEVLDLPEAIEHASKLALAEGLSDVVSHRAGDALIDDLGTGYDVVFLSNFLHHLTPPDATRLLARARAAICPGGTVAVHDMRQADTADDVDLIGDAFALFFRLTSSARCYTVHEYEGWIRAAGFINVKVHSFLMGMTLVTGEAP
jgi:2-polyprenyl-3-methyl-5-hydroxy-6-metoxy-1,4-benzoquinol methylase